MRFDSWLIDSRIRAINVAVEFSVGEYWDLAEEILLRNDLQRKQVKSAGKTYELLRRDLLDGCIMPPIILALSEDRSALLGKEVVRAVNRGKLTVKETTLFKKTVEDAVKAQEIIILDGLQRTYTIGDCIEVVQGDGRLRTFRKHPLRAEIYIGLSKLGILYRMLTLNTGQTPMSFRHQIEMLYHDYIDRTSLPEGISIVREVDEGRARGLGKYKYSDVVDLFHSFATGVPQSMSKQDVISSMREMDFLEEYKAEVNHTDKMLELLVTYNQFVSRVTTLAEEWEWTDEDTEQFKITHPFGKTPIAIFGRVQSMTGFGAECKRLISSGLVRDLTKLKELIAELQFKADSADDSLYMLCRILHGIATSATKVGDAQRSYFQFCFRHLFNSESPGYLDLGKCWILGHQTYKNFF